MVDESPLTVAQEMANVLRDLASNSGQPTVTEYTPRYLKSLYDRWNIATARRVGSRPSAVQASEPNAAPSREDVWMHAWCSVAGAFNCQKPEDATRWADEALIAFDERFPR